jgi:hypothetical protein
MPNHKDSETQRSLSAFLSGHAQVVEDLHSLSMAGRGGGEVATGAVQLAEGTQGIRFKNAIPVALRQAQRLAQPLLGLGQIALCQTNLAQRA